MPLYNNSHQGQTQFSLLHRSLLQSDDLPSSSLVSDQRIAEIFAEEEVDFGQTDDAFYTPAMTLWGLLSQVFFKEEQRSCLAAVVRIAALWLALGRKIDSTNTGAYCRARNKIPNNVLRRISREIALRATERADPLPADAGIGPASSYAGGRFIMVDGFTVTAADTAANQAEYPQQKSQKPGVGLPIARAVAILSLATACVTDVAIGPYSGKETGETALLRQLSGSLHPGDVAVMDRYYCSFMMIALLLGRNVDVCTRMHQKRHVDFRRGRRLGKYDHIIV